MIILKKLLNLLSPPEKKRAFFLLLMILVMAMLEMIGVVSIVNILMNPIYDTNNLLNAFLMLPIYLILKQRNNFCFFRILFFNVVVSLTFKFLTFYIQLRFTNIKLQSCKTYQKDTISTFSWF